MKIIEDIIEFGNLIPGTSFGYLGNIYMKTSNIGEAVSLESGCVKTFRSNFEAKIVNAEVKIG